MNNVQLLTPSTCPSIRSKPGEQYIRIDKNSISISTALAAEMTVTTGSKVILVKLDNETFYLTPAPSEDGFTLKGNKQNLHFSNSVIIGLLTDAFSIKSLLEEGKFTSFRLTVTKKMLPYIVAGVDTYWHIEPPKKLEVGGKKS